MEKNNQVSIISYPQNFQRSSKDKSSLNLTITELARSELVNGEIFNVNLSLSHIRHKSYANAYNIEMFIYFDSNFLNFQSIQFENNPTLLKILPTKNVTKPGLIHIHTDELWLPTSHLAIIKFKVTIPKGIMKGDQCEGAFVVDFKYVDNLKEFNGTLQNTTNKRIPYKCKIDQWVDISLTPSRLSTPQFSMLYDDVNGEFFFCFQRTKYATRNSPLCYRQTNDSKVWHAIAHIVSLKGVDVAARELFGTGRQGAAYFLSFHPYDGGFAIEDTHWTAAEGRSSLRKSVKVQEISSLPSNPTNEMIIATSGVQLWAATKSGIMKKSGDTWNTVIAF